MTDSRASLKTSLITVESDTSLTTLYVMIDDFCKSHLVPEHRGGTPASLTPSEVLTLALFGHWRRFPSERGFYRYAQWHLRGAYQPLAETFLVVRHQPHLVLAQCRCPSPGPFVTDKGFEGVAWYSQWRHAYGAKVICALKRDSKRS